jgi:Ulp1 family protease
MTNISPNKLVDYQGPLGTTHAQFDELVRNPRKKRQRDVKCGRRDMAVSSCTSIEVVAADKIINASVDVKYRVKAHLVMRRGLHSDCNMGEVIADTNIFVTGGDNKIVIRDMRGLGQGLWINDKIVDIVMGGIQHEARVRNGVKADLYMSVCFYSMLAARGHSGTHNALTRKNKGDEGTRLFTIVNTRKSTHFWVAVEVCCTRKVVTIMGSLRPTPGSIEYVELQVISKTLGTWTDTEAKLVQEGKGGAVGTLACLSSTQPWMFECCQQCPQQTNGYDCGMFALATVAARSKGATQHNISDMQEQRNVLAAWIVSLHCNNEK